MMLYAALAIIAACMLYFFLITFCTVPESGKRYADIILGVLTGSGFTLLLTFYWGAAKKDEVVKKEEP